MEKRENLKDQWREWLIPVLVMWLSAAADVLVTYLTGSPAREANPLIVYLFDGFSFLEALLIVLVPFTLIQTGVVLAFWKTKFDVFAFAFAVGIAVVHFIGAMSWFDNVYFLLVAPMISCLIVGFLLDLFGVTLKLEE